jgi:methionyl-tRNA formyltransferase
MRTVFMGSPPFAVPSLEALSGRYQVVGVITQPDQPAGRGRSLKPSAIKSWSLEHGLPTAQPKSLKSQDALNQLRAWKPELIVVAAFGQILPPQVLELPKWGCLNVHASLLPRWRGAAPVQAAILHGDAETGVTIMKMERGLDTGPVLSQQRTPILSDETGGQLTARLSILGSELLLDTIPEYIVGNINPTDQDHTKATSAPMLKKEDGLLDFYKPAEALERQVRAFEPWPGSFFLWSSRRIVIRKAHVIPGDYDHPGQVIPLDKFSAVTTAAGFLVLDIVQPAGRKQMSAEAFVRGAKGFLGTSLLPTAKDNEHHV